MSTHKDIRASVVFIGPDEAFFRQLGEDIGLTGEMYTVIDPSVHSGEADAILNGILRIRLMNIVSSGAKLIICDCSCTHALKESQELESLDRWPYKDYTDQKLDIRLISRDDLEYLPSIRDLLREKVVSCIY